MLHYPYFKEKYKMIAIDLSKQQALDSDSRSIQQINFTENLNRAVNTIIFFIIEEAKRNCFGLFTRSCKGIVKYVIE